MIHSLTVSLSHLFTVALALPLLVSSSDADTFRVTHLGTTGAAAVEHSALTGDDRGGIVASGSSVFVTGDTTTGRFNLADLSGGVALDGVQDGLVGNLRDGNVYVLADQDMPLQMGGGTITTLVQIDGDTGLPTTNRVTLSETIEVTWGSGIFSGYDRIVIHDGTRVYNIDLPSGIVTDLGLMKLPPHRDSESWAFWGIAEFFGGFVHLVCVRDEKSISRTRVPDTESKVIAAFSNLSDMASVTFSTLTNRWYFHTEGVSEFRDGDETVGYADARWDQPGNRVAPEAVSDRVAGPANQAIRIDVLSNDWHYANSMRVTSVTSQSAEGGAVVIEDGEVIYRPADGFNGEDSFTYTVSDDAGMSTSAGVSVRVVRENALLSVGYNYSGQLGTADFVSSNDPVPVAGNVMFQAVAAGSDHSLALATDQTVWAFGENYEGQLGNGTHARSPSPIQIPGLQNVTAIATHGEHNLCLFTDGTLAAWGRSYEGQLGSPGSLPSGLPRAVPNLDTVVAIATGSYHSLACKSDGTVWAWGHNDYGQMGDGTYVTRSTPTPVAVA